MAASVDCVLDSSLDYQPRPGLAVAGLSTDHRGGSSHVPPGSLAELRRGVQTSSGCELLNPMGRHCPGSVDRPHGSWSRQSLLPAVSAPTSEAVRGVLSGPLATLCYSSLQTCSQQPSLSERR